jgi:hypothetical protein
MKLIEKMEIAVIVNGIFTIFLLAGDVVILRCHLFDSIICNTVVSEVFRMLWCHQVTPIIGDRNGLRV